MLWIYDKQFAEEKKYFQIRRIMKKMLLGLPNLKAIYEKSIIQQNFY